MTLYWSIYAALAFIGMSTDRRVFNNGAALLVGGFLVLFVGTRLNTGCDFGTYWNRFLNLYHGADLTNVLSRSEPGFHLLNWIIFRLDVGYVWLLVASALICVYAIFRFSRYAPQPLLYVALSFPILIVQLSMSGLRQALALAFLFLALDAFIRVRRVQIAFWVLVASTFHQSAVIFLPLAFIAGRQFRLSRIVVALLLASPVVAVLLQERMEVYDDRYISQVYGENSSSGAVLRYLLTLGPFVAYFALRQRVNKAFPAYQNLLMLFFAISVAMLPLIGISTVVLHRLTYYIMPVSLLAFIVSSQVYFARDRTMAAAVPAAIYGLYIVVWFSLSRHAQSCYVPYDTFLLN